MLFFRTCQKFGVAPPTDATVSHDVETEPAAEEPSIPTDVPDNQDDEMAFPSNYEELCVYKKLMSIPEILSCRSFWKDDKDEEEDKSNVSLRKERKNYDYKWRQIVPWILQVKDPQTKKVLEVLCTVC